MNPLLLSILAPILKDVVGKIVNKLPVGQAEKDRAVIETESVLAEHADVIADAEAKISTNRAAEWIADVTSSSWLAKNWRPILGVACTAIMVWETILVGIINAILMWGGHSLIPYAPQYLTDSAFYTLLGLIGVRSAEKINAVRKV